MKGFVHHLLKGKDNDIPTERVIGHLPGTPINPGGYPFEPPPVHVVPYRRTREALRLKPGAVCQEAFWQGKEEPV
jgi:hypothetical protein